MPPNKKVIAVQSVGMILAMGVGVLIGAKSCAETEIRTHREYMAPPKAKVVEKIVYECPPEEKAEDDIDAKKIVKKVVKKSTDTGEAKPKKKKENLPEENAAAQNKRKRLLSVVRAKSKATLQSCRGSDKQVYRLSVSLVAKKDGSVSTVRVNSPPGEVPAGILNCLRGRMMQWTLPEADVVAQQPIVWGLTL